MIGHIERDQFGIVRDAGVAGGGIEFSTLLGKQAGLRQLPSQRMFASTRSQQEDIHARPFFR